MGVLLVLKVVMVVVVMMVEGVRSDLASDRTECTSQLVGLATCLPYVQGTGKAPTPDCCSGLKEVLAKSPKCLCILVKDRNDPQLGININATLALSLPSACGSPANVSECPRLLKLPPNSPEADIFKQHGSGANADSVPGNATVKGNSTAAHASSGGRSHYMGRKEWLGVEWVVGLSVVPLLVLAS